MRPLSCKLRTMGISNSAFDYINNIQYSLQFYDYDLPKLEIDYIKDFEKILMIFPYDCITYRTKHGIHFISFSLIEGFDITRKRAIRISKQLGNQDYFTEQEDLILRVKSKRNRKRDIISLRPEFHSFFFLNVNCTISKTHLDFYKNFLNLPYNIYEKYLQCNSIETELRTYHYKARD